MSEQVADTVKLAKVGSESMVTKVSKLLNQAERSPEGSPEREAFMERALQLSQAYSIDLAVARATQAKKERIEEPERRQFTVGEHGPRKDQRNRFLADLMIAICDANDIEVTISSSAVYVWGTGMPSDLDMAERLFTLLSVQMMSEADAALKAGANYEKRLVPKRVRVELSDDERAWGQHDGTPNSYGESCYYDDRDEDTQVFGDTTMRLRYNNAGHSEWVKSYPPPKFENKPVLDDDGNPVLEEKMVSVSDGRIWRANFYDGFINRTRARLREAKRAALKEAGIDVTDDSDSRALALRDKKKEVRDAFEENEKFVLSSGRTYQGAEVSRHDYSGQLAGDEAGKRARLGNERDLGD